VLAVSIEADQRPEGNTKESSPQEMRSLSLDIAALVVGWGTERIQHLRGTLSVRMKPLRQGYLVSLAFHRPSLDPAAPRYFGTYWASTDQA